MKAAVPPMQIIVALARKGAIGRRGDLLCHISEDLRRFKAITSGGVVVMGRKTWESLPRRPLPNRLNIVLTRNAGYEASGAEVVTSLERARELAAAYADTYPAGLFIIGGGEIYRMAFPLAEILHITYIDAKFDDADTFFPEILPDEWELTEEIPSSLSSHSSHSSHTSHSSPPYTFRTYKRLIPTPNPYSLIPTP